MDHWTTRKYIILYKKKLIKVCTLMYYKVKQRQTFLPLIGVNVFWSHELTYESGLSHSSWSHQWYCIRSDVVAAFVLMVLLLLLILNLLLLYLLLLTIIVVRDRWCEFLRVVFSGKAVAPRPAFPERISSIDDTYERNIIVVLLFFWENRCV